MHLLEEKISHTKFRYAADNPVISIMSGNKDKTRGQLIRYGQQNEYLNL